MLGIADKHTLRVEITDCDKLSGKQCAYQESESDSYIRNQEFHCQHIAEEIIKKFSGVFY